MEYIDRLLKPVSHSFFLFGARGVGKSTWLKHALPKASSYWVDLLDPAVEDRLSRSPGELASWVAGLPEHITHVVIDEIQKVPRLLDVVHQQLERDDNRVHFVLTGSSARKLRASGVNLLAGRALVYELFAFSVSELGESIDVASMLRFGLLPKVVTAGDPILKRELLSAYALTYLKEEIWAEHLIRRLEPFRAFLEVAAQCNGHILNFANVARDVGVDEKTVKNYFSILEDTLLAVSLPPFHPSFRRRVRANPKFYFLDVGIARALARHLTLEPMPGTSYYGGLFESLVVTESWKLNRYHQRDFRLSYLRTAGGAEIDLVIERPGQRTLFVEIKSKQQVTEGDLASLKRIADEAGAKALCWSQDPYAKVLNGVEVLPWREGLCRYVGEGASAAGVDPAGGGGACT